MNRKLTICMVLLAVVAFGQTALAQKKKTKMDKPTISCGGSTASSIDIRVCAGAAGAPAGFSIQWMTAADIAANGWYLSDDVRLCKASFSGNANGSSYNLAAGQCITVQIGDDLFDDPGASSNCAVEPLVCGTEYVFHAFAHANSTLQRSDFTANMSCSTSLCEGVCSLTQGYWKTHGPIPTGNNANAWPVSVQNDGLTLGNVPYTPLQLLDILNTPAQGNGLLTLAHQLIAAKINIANGADPGPLGTAIADADALIGNLVIPPVGTDALAASATSALTTILDNYNNGLLPGTCHGTEAPPEP